MKNIAIVTGASSGMGRDFVLELLKEKSIDEIWMIARRGQRLEKMALKRPEKLRCLPLDLTDVATYEEIRNVLAEKDVRIRYLVNAAGFGKAGKVEDIEAQAHSAMIELNVHALTLMTKICLPYMGKNSDIIQLCSSSAFLPQPGFATYAASKAYVLSFSRALRRELKEYKINVTIVCPGPVNTEFFKASGQEIHPSKKKYLAESRSVVKQAIKDTKQGKELSIYGKSMKMIHLAGKVLPTKFLLFLSERILN